MQKIFMVFTCDTWKSKTSEKVVMCTLSQGKLKAFIVWGICNDYFVYGDSSYSKDRQVELFMTDFERFSEDNEFRFINDHLEFGRIDYVYDGSLI